jgi:hypothetical protein
MSNGRGKEVLVDGTIYDGQWYLDEKHGEGILINSNGTFKQVYSNGILISE